ncbi:hypothetical protein [Nocardioides sp. P5_C9_2]
MIGFVLSLLTGTPPATAGETSPPEPTGEASVGTTTDGPGGFGASGTDQSPQGSSEGEGQETGAGGTESALATSPDVIWKLGDLSCDTYSGVGCVTPNRCPDDSVPRTWTMIDAATGEPLGTYDQCPEDPPPTAETTPTATVDIPAEVLKAFEKVTLPESAINVQPPGGETLVNLPTILSTSAARHQIPVHLDRVNIDVLLEVWPSQFVWQHGDETSQTTSTPGKAWTEGADMADLITHTYAKTSEGLDLSVDTTWSAQFKVVGEPDWRPVDGTVTIAGAPVSVAVLEAKPQLVH